MLFFGIINSELPSEGIYISYISYQFVGISPNQVIFYHQIEKTPLITGLKSSLPVAKIVELIPLERISLFREAFDASLISIGLGNSSAGTNAILYLPSLAVISRIFLLELKR